MARKQQSTPQPTELPDRMLVSLPADNPIYADLRAFLGQLPRRGAGSQVPAVLAHFVVLGFDLYRGKIAAPGGTNPNLGATPSGASLEDMTRILDNVSGSNEWSFD